MKKLFLIIFAIIAIAGMPVMAETCTLVRASHILVANYYQAEQIRKDIYTQ